MLSGKIKFPEFSGLRCLMMPYIQGDPLSVPAEFHGYSVAIRELVLRKGEVGFLTIDESVATQGSPHRGKRARYGRALHTEAGKVSDGEFCWGMTVWGGSPSVTLDPDVQVLLANNIDDSCAVWDVVHEDTSADGDIGYCAEMYPYSSAVLLKSGEVHRIGILTPHESLPVRSTVNRQFLRIVSSGVHGREPYFTENPLMC